MCCYSLLSASPQPPPLPLPNPAPAVKEVRNSAFVVGLKEHMAQLRHSKLYKQVGAGRWGGGAAWIVGVAPLGRMHRRVLRDGTPRSPCLAAVPQPPQLSCNLITVYLLRRARRR